MDSIGSYGVVTRSIDVTFFLKGIHSFCQCVKSTMFQGHNVLSPTTTAANSDVFMILFFFYLLCTRIICFQYPTWIN